METIEDSLESLKHRVYGSLFLLFVLLVAIGAVWIRYPEVGVTKLGWVLIVWSWSGVYISGRLIAIWTVPGCRFKPNRILIWLLLSVSTITGLAGIGCATAGSPFPFPANIDDDLLGQQVLALLFWGVAWCFAFIFGVRARRTSTSAGAENGKHAG